MINRIIKHNGVQFAITIVDDVVVCSSHSGIIRLKTGREDGDAVVIAWLAQMDDREAKVVMATCAEPPIQGEFHDELFDEIVDALKIGKVKAELIKDQGALFGYSQMLKCAAANLDAVTYEKLNKETAEWMFPLEAKVAMAALRSFARHFVFDRPMTIEQVATAVIMAQNAVNIAGLVNSWAEWIPVIRADAQARGIALNDHPVHTMMADKVKSLTLANDYGDAYKELQEIAARPPH